MTAFAASPVLDPPIARRIPRIDPAADILKRMAAMQRIRRMSRLLDTRWKIPGTQWRFGLDPLIGLIPGVGALVTLGASIYLLTQARTVGAPWPVMLGMMGNVAVDFVAGEIPVAGDIFDFAFKAHIRNLHMLERWMARAETPATNIVVTS